MEKRGDGRIHPRFINWYEETTPSSKVNQMNAHHHNFDINAQSALIHSKLTCQDRLLEDLSSPHPASAPLHLSLGAQFPAISCKDRNTRVGLHYFLFLRTYAPIQFTTNYFQCCCLVTRLCPTLWPHGLQHNRLPCLPTSPGVCSNLCPLSPWCCPSHPLSPPSPFAFNLSQHQGLFQWVGSSHQMSKVLELQHQSFQWISRVHFH